VINSTRRETMGSRRYFLLALFFPIASLAQSTSTASPASVDYCTLVANPEVYAGKEIRLRGKVSLEFENFTLYNPQCYNPPQVWLMFGGDVATPTMSLWGDQSRLPKTNLKFRGVKYSLEQDEAFHDFYKHIVARKDKEAVYRVTATLTGTFFGAAPKRDQRLRANLPGYGHFGCCFLLIISRVSDVESNPFTNDWDEMMKKKIEELRNSKRR
jgi:hypothetical protein